MIAFGASLAIILRLVPRSVVPVVFATGGFGIVLLWVRNKWWLGTLLGAICSLAGAAMAELFVPVDGEGKILLGHILGAVSCMFGNSCIICLPVKMKYLKSVST